MRVSDVRDSNAWHDPVARSKRKQRLAGDSLSHGVKHVLEHFG